MTADGWRSQLPLLAQLLRRIGDVDWRREGWRDLLALLFLVAAGWHLAGHDGGKPLASLVPALVLGAGVLLAATRELERGSRLVLWLVAAWALGPLVALAFAWVRSGWVQPTAALALAVPAFLAARHLWRQPAGPLILGVVLGAAGVRAWWEAFLAWWGGSGGNAWLALSWHNQSGTLMGALALLGFGMAAAGGARWVRGAGFVLAALGGAGTWLAASRAAVVLATAGLGIAAAVALRHRAPRQVGAVLVGVTLLSVGTTLALGSFVGAPGTGAERLLERGLDGGNLMVRFDYWQGAWGMLRDAPLTGTGPGSYPWASLPHASLNTPRSASVHNEYLDVLAGHGIVGGLPVWLATLAAAGLVLGALGMISAGAGGPGPLVRDPPKADSRAGGQLTGTAASAAGPPPGVGSPGAAGVVAAAGVLTLLGLHAGFDFDWDYPILLVAAAVGVGVLSAALRTPEASGAQPTPLAQETSGTAGRRPGPAPPRLAVGAAVGASALLLGVALWGVLAETRGTEAPPWTLDPGLRAAWAAAAAGDVDSARGRLETVARWNPRAPTLPAVIALVDYQAGDLDPNELADLATGFPGMDERLLAAEHLLAAGAADAATWVLTALRPYIEERSRWRVEGRVARLVALSLALEELRGGCNAVAAAWPRERAWAQEVREVDEAALRAAWEDLDPSGGLQGPAGARCALP